MSILQKKHESFSELEGVIESLVNDFVSFEDTSNMHIFDTFEVFS